MTIQDIMDTVDAVTEPGKMTPTKALEFLEQLATEIDCRIDGLKDELRNAELEES